MKLSEVPTPALCADVDALRANVERMAAFFEGRACSLRPHFKAHKTPAIARLQARAGCDGFTCATVGEAEVLAANGFTDVLIANEVTDPAKAGRVRALAREIDLTVAFDSIEGVDLLADAPVGALVDVNVGMPRCGIAPDKAPGLARYVSKAGALRLRGVMGYEGHVQAVGEPAKREHMARKSMGILLEAADAIRADGLPCEVVSGGGTGTYDISGAIDGVTEIQAGSYALMDMQYHATRPEFAEALRLVVSVVSVGDGIAVLDGGLKAVSVDHGPPHVPEGCPADVLYLADEHTTLTMRDGFDLRPGDRMWLRTTHVDPTVNLHDRIVAIRGDDVVDIWPVAARGYRAP